VNGFGNKRINSLDFMKISAHEGDSRIDELKKGTNNCVSRKNQRSHGSTFLDPKVEPLLAEKQGKLFAICFLSLIRTGA